MTEITLKYIHAFTDRHGHPRRYFRRGNVKTPLPGEPGSREFMDAYAAALAGSSKPQKPEPRQAIAPGTFAALAAAYYQSPRFKRLAAGTRENYRRIIDGYNQQNGHRRVAGIRYEHIEKAIGDLSDKPGKATSLLKVLKLLLSHAVRLGWIAANPAREVESYSSGEYHAWTEAEIAQYEAHWPIGTRQRLAFDTLLYTGQRVSDAHLMPVPDAQDKMRFQQKKTGVWMVVRAHRRLKESIAAAGVKATIINLNAWHRPYASGKTFSQFVASAVRAAGLPEECVRHGLRKAAARRLAEIGCSAHEIMSLTGHKTLMEVEHYTRAVEQERMNDQATDKHEATEKA